MRQQSLEIGKDFVTMLESFWKPFNVNIWKLDKNFSSFHGEEIKAFVRNSNKVVEFMK